MMDTKNGKCGFVLRTRSTARQRRPAGRNESRGRFATIGRRKQGTTRFDWHGGRYRQGLSPNIERDEANSSEFGNSMQSLIVRRGTRERKEIPGGLLATQEEI
jgi:hypothetical protein